MMMMLMLIADIILIYYSYIFTNNILFHLHTLKKYIMKVTLQMMLWYMGFQGQVASK